MVVTFHTIQVSLTGNSSTSVTKGSYFWNRDLAAYVPAHSNNSPGLILTTNSCPLSKSFFGNGVEIDTSDDNLR